MGQAEFYTFYRGSTSQGLALGDAGAVVTSRGPGVLAHFSHQTGVADNTLTLGNSVTLYGTVWFSVQSGDRCDILIEYNSDSAQAATGSGAIPLIVSRDTAAVGVSPAIVAPGPGRFSQASLSIATAPSGSALTMALRKNGSVATTITIPNGIVAPVQQNLSLTFEAGDILDVECTSVGSSTPATGVGYVAWMILDSLGTVEVPVDSDGGPYMDLVLEEATLVSYWGLADTVGTTALDHESLHTGFYAGGVTSDQPSLVSGGDHSAIFDGTGYVSVPGSAALHLPSFTLEAWIKPTTLPVGAMIMDIGGGGYVSFYFSDPGLTTTTKLIGIIWNGTSNYQVTGTNTIATGVTKHVALTWDDATKDFKIYINGVQDSTVNHPGVAISYAVPTISAIGAAASGGSNFFHGTIDEPAIYSSALSAPTLLAHYNQGVS